MISEFQPKNIMISDFWAKNNQKAESHVLSDRKFNEKSFFISKILLDRF